MTKNYVVYDIYDVDVTMQRPNGHRQYEDSVTIFTIVSKLDDINEEKLWKFCVETLLHCDVRDDNATHDGHCGFPHGLDSYGSLVKFAKFQWRYTVTEPFCD